MPSSSRDSEVKSLEADTASLKCTLVRLRQEEDRWNTLNRRLAIFAVLSGGLFGLASWLAQNAAVSSALRARPLDDDLSVKTSRIRDLQDQ